MARNDGIDRTSARNVDVPDKDIGNTQKHNEREKDSYRNPDIVPERTPLNIHFKAPTASYTEMFRQMEQDKIISTRGLKPDAIHFGELIFDVNSAYFHNHGGYEFARQFYADAYKAAVEIVGGEQYILSAVMHADEINRAMSEALGQEVYHYHLHVVYVPVVEKQILWSKRCKDKSLVGTVKETVMQVSRSKKWMSKPALDADGNPVLQTVTQFKVQAEQQRLEAVTAQVAQAEQTLSATEAAAQKKAKELKSLQSQTKEQRTVALTVQEVQSMGKKNPITGNISLTPQECDTLKSYAVNSITVKADNGRLQERLASAQKSAAIWKKRYESLNEKYQELKKSVQPYLDAVKLAPERVRAFLAAILTRTQQTRQHEQPVRRGQDMEL